MSEYDEWLFRFRKQYEAKVGPIGAEFEAVVARNLISKRIEAFVINKGAAISAGYEILSREAWP